MKYAIRFTKTLPDGHVEWSRPEEASQTSLYVFDRNGHQHWLADFNFGTGDVIESANEYDGGIFNVQGTGNDLIFEVSE